MVTWILTSSAIVVLSAVAMELVREVTLAEATPSGSSVGDRAGSWEDLSESDLDDLLEEFVRAGEERLVPSAQGSV